MFPAFSKFDSKAICKDGAEIWAGEREHNAHEEKEWRKVKTYENVRAFLSKSFSLSLCCTQAAVRMVNCGKDSSQMLSRSE